MHSKLLILLGYIALVHSHGRMMKPPNRSSIWRVPEFSGQNPPANYDDNALYCGGTHQADDPGSNCGVCGDPAGQPSPKDNEIGGRWYRGIIVATYSAGATIDVEVELTVAHMGNMEWRLCTNTGSASSQSCFNQNVLRLASGGTKYPVSGSGMHRIRVVLPSGVRCNHCVLQWNYRAGNTWGYCPNGSGASGCGPQETFRGCSDIRIN